MFRYGQCLFYKRTGETRYFHYTKAWVDRFVTDSGTSFAFDSLDEMRPGQLLSLLFQKTGEPKCRTAADQLRSRFPGYPRTSDGGMIHNTGLVGQLWCDGTYMAQPFLALYGRASDDQAYCFEESAKNLAGVSLPRPPGRTSSALDDAGERRQRTADARASPPPSITDGRRALACWLCGEKCFVRSGTSSWHARMS